MSSAPITAPALRTLIVMQHETIRELRASGQKTGAAYQHLHTLRRRAAAVA